MKKTSICLLALACVTFQGYAQVKKAPVKTATTMSVDKPRLKNSLDSFSYAAGMNIASNMQQQGITDVNTALMTMAIEDVFKKNKPLMTLEQCNMALQQQVQNSAKKKSAGEVAKGKAFLAANKDRAGVTTLPNGLQYEILTAGDPNGIKPAGQDTVVVDYAGTLIDGKKFDASADHGGPATFPVNGVIRGWTEILQMMTKGAKWKVYIPGDLAYGDRGAGEAIPPGATLIFEIDLKDIKPAAVK